MNIQDFAIKNIIPLAEKFAKENQSFVSHYKKFIFYIHINQTYSAYHDMQIVLKNSLEHLKESTFSDLQYIEIGGNFRFFQKKDMENFNFHANLSFQFEEFTYKIVQHFRTEKVICLLEKPYSKQLTKEEINEIIGTEIRRHMAFIKQKMKAIKT
ncbi:MAG: hypothetical protein ACPG5B_06400 [Chitinophagales bacterium]